MCEIKGIPDYDPGGACRSVKNELRRNLLRSIEKGETLFPGIHGYEDTVVPQIVNALLSRHNFILLALPGPAKRRILRGLVNLLDPEMPVIAGCEINDDPLKPICRACREKVAADGDNTPISWMPRDNRFVEKLATPDVTMADIIGDVDPIRAARGGRDLSDELTIHYGLLPRANRVGRRSGLSQRLPITTLDSLVSSAEQRAARTGEKSVVARVADVYAALPAITGKMELEYEGELKGADTVARELIRTAVGRVFSKHFSDVNFQAVIQWFELGGELKLPELATTNERHQQLAKIQGLMEHVGRLGIPDRKDAGAAAAAAEMVLEGLWAHRRIGRSEERGYYAEKPKHPDQRERETPGRPPRRQFN